ncbi:MAG: N-acetylglucosamine kinase [Caldicoprobacterales bacterium]
MSYYLGVDGGGSKTIAVVSDSKGQILGRGKSGCGNHQLNPETARRSITEAVETALKQAALEKSAITFALFGLAGADREEDFRILIPMISKLGFKKSEIVCDTVIGLRAGTIQPYGIVLVCGSGTNSYGVNRAGENLQVGGFGYVFGDFGGGYSLAEEVFRAVIRSWEGRGAKTKLTDATIRILGFNSVETMFNAFLNEKRNIPHELSRLLFDVGSDDEVALSILKKQGTELGLAACAVIKRLCMEQDSFDVVLVGSILTRTDNQYLISVIEQTVKATAPRCTLRKLTVEPVMGSVLLAMERSGITVEDSVYKTLEKHLALDAKGGEFK